MKSVKSPISKQRRTYTRLIGEIQHALNQALTEENVARGLTRAKMAEILRCDRGTITKLFSGTRNMTLETLADLAYALDRPVRVSLPSRSATNQYVEAPQANPVPKRTTPQNIDAPKPPIFADAA